MILRAVLIAVAVLTLAWLAVLWRNHELGTDATARLAGEAELSPAEVERELRRLEDAELLSPDSTWRLRRAEYLVRHDQLPRAAAEAEALLRDEPDNRRAWIVLALATARSDPQRSAQARAEIERLDPLATRD